eukprot:gene3149-5465_t
MKPNTFRAPHKFYRNLWSTTLHEFGCLDFTENFEVDLAYELLENLFQTYIRLHIKVELEMAQNLIQEIDEKLFKKWTEQQENSIKSYDGITNKIKEIKKEKDFQKRVEFGEEMYLKLQNLYATTLQQMEYEETTINDFLQKNCKIEDIISCDQKSTLKSLYSLPAKEIIDFMAEVIETNSFNEQFGLLMSVKGILKMKLASEGMWNHALKIFETKCKTKQRWEKLQKFLDLKY